MGSGPPVYIQKITRTKEIEKNTVNGSFGYINNISSPLVLYAIGVKYDLGVDAPADLTRAAPCYRRAAEQGHAMAQFNLGSMYNHGRGVENENVESVRWYREAANQGVPNAQCSLGHMYFEGMGVEKNWEEAVIWFRLSAAQGNRRAADAARFITARTQAKMIPLPNRQSHSASFKY